MEQRGEIYHKNVAILKIRMKDLQGEEMKQILKFP